MPRGPRNLAEATDERHHVRGGDATIEVDLAALDDFQQVFGADDVCTGSLGFVSLDATGEHSNANVSAGAVRQVDDAANHLVGVTRVNAEVHGDLDGFVELGDGPFLDHCDGVRQGDEPRRIDTFADLLHALCELCHDQPTTSRPMERAEPSTIAIAPSTSAALRSFILPSAIART